ncbi:hypothetical protein [Xenorhabdus bovienii]|uniref:hypothetical protein n=1 Tax=Xenorhabdus bovienii TaxID=40576 RepID=UPI000170B2E0|nr:hypothetical protein [Xenorhabdus bovienii]MDE9543897.1 hypothetical protein [Xenorhabdus bovienii]
MAKSPAERKAAQRQRQQEAGVTKIELLLDNQELDMLKRNCVLKRPRRNPYEVVEYLASLICKDEADLRQKKCGDNLPVAECCFSGEATCWNTLGWHELKL